MRTANGVLLFYATFLIEPAIAAVRLGVLDLLIYFQKIYYSLVD
jgi:hypothetical protein